MRWANIMPYMIANLDGIRFILLARETSANYIISQIKTRATGLSGLSRTYAWAAEVSSF